VTTGLQQAATGPNNCVVQCSRARLGAVLGGKRAFEKPILSHPAVTCVIPGIRRRLHMEENAAAGIGPAPDPKFWLDKPVVG